MAFKTFHHETVRNEYNELMCITCNKMLCMICRCEIPDNEVKCKDCKQLSTQYEVL